MKKTAIVYLEDILDSIEKIELFTQDVSWEVFERDVMLQDAIIRRLMLIGEAVRRLRESFRGVAEKIPWREIVGMRNLLIHEYDEIEIWAVWQVIAGGELKELKKKVKNLLD